MKSFVGFNLVLSCFVAISASAQPNLGKKIDVANDSSGTPSIGLQYASQSTKMVSVSLSITGRSLVGETSKSIAPAQWAIFNKVTGAQISSWADLQASAALVDPNATQAFTLAVGVPAEILAVASSLNNSALAISLNSAPPSAAPSVYIDIGELCTTAPTKFVNLDTFATGCN